jgi:hypothetical protein
MKNKEVKKPAADVKKEAEKQLADKTKAVQEGKIVQK